MEFMSKWNLAIQSTFIAGLVVGTAIVIGFFVMIIKPKANRKFITILYSFSSGFMIPLGTFGLIGGAFGHIDEYFVLKKESGWIPNALTMIIISSGILIGCAIYFISRSLLTKKEIHNDHQEHPHSDLAINYSEIDLKNRRWLAIIFIVLHRVPAGLTLGLLTFGLNSNLSEQISIGIVIAFIIHIIPESLIVYYRQVQIGLKPHKALLNAIYTKLFMIPFIFIGAYLAKGIDNIYWLFPLILTIGGTLITLTAILELMPEFIHYSTSDKNWKQFTLAIMSGLLIAFLVLVIHHH